MRRAVNFRCFLITSLVAVLCVLLYALTSGAVRAVSLSCLIAAVVGFTAAAFLARDFVKGVSLALAFAVAVVCLISTGSEFSRWSNDLEAEREYAFTGVIASVNSSETDQTYYLRDLTADEVEIDGGMLLAVGGARGTVAAALKAGDKITFTATAAYNEPIDGLGGYEYRNDLRYSAAVTAETITFIGGEAGFFDRLKNSMKETLDDDLGGYGALAHAVLTGDKGGLEDGVTDYYGTSGIGHILAVSGLHVGFITAAIAFLLDKLKVKRLVKLIVTTAFLLFYCFLASFSPSVIRASVMCVVGLYADAFGKQRDSLSALCLAVTVILLVKPLYVFDVGFVMSVTAVGGILAFSSSFEFALSKILPRKLASAIAVSSAAQLGITPVTLVCFNSLTPYSVLTNLVVIPIMSVTFVLVLLSLALVALIPSFGIILTISGAGLVVVDTVARLVSFIPFSEITVLAGEAFLFSYLLLFCCSRYFMLGKKIINGAIALCVCVAALVAFNVPLASNGDVVVCSGYKSVTTVLITERGRVIVGDVGRYDEISGALKRAQISKVDAIVLTKLTDENAATVINLCGKYGISKVYFAPSVDFSGLQTLVSGGVEAEIFVDEFFGLVPIIGGDGCVGYGCPSLGVLTLSNDYTARDVNSEILSEYPIVRAARYDDTNKGAVYLVNYVNRYAETEPYAQSAASDGTFKFNAYSGQLKKI